MNNHRFRQAIFAAGLTFILSTLAGLGSNTLVAAMPVGLSVVLLLSVVFIGIVFDTIGVAAAAAQPDPFHAMASKRVPGARQSLWMVKNADKVANFSSDVIGDIAGTLSGAIGTFIVFSFGFLGSDINLTLFQTVAISLIAALTVGGKALGKHIAIHRSTEILLYSGKALRALQYLGIEIGIDNKKRKGGKGDTEC